MMGRTSPDLGFGCVTTLHVTFSMNDDEQKGQFRDVNSVVSK
jgi:hypothetical protein